MKDLTQFERDVIDLASHWCRPPEGEWTPEDALDALNDAIIDCDRDYNLAAKKRDIFQSLSRDLLASLRGLVRINEEHNEAVGKVMGKPASWKDDYLNPSRKLIAKADGLLNQI